MQLTHKGPDAGEAQCRPARKELAPGQGFEQVLLKDIRFAFRLLLRNPGFSLIAGFTLALGIGACSAAFSLIQGVLLRPLPYPQPERIMLLSSVQTSGASDSSGLSAAEQWTGWQQEARAFETISGYRWAFDYLILSNGSKPVCGMEVSGDYFRTLGVRPFLGRGFLDAKAEASAIPIILGYDLWKRQFNCDSNILGKAVHLSRSQAPLTVVGVMPFGIRTLPSPANASDPYYDANGWVDFWIAAEPEANKTWRTWNVAGRLRDGVPLPQAQAELTAVAARQAQNNPSAAGLGVRIQSLIDVSNRDARQVLLPLAITVALVFVLACANIAGLLLARGLQRQQEFALRCALGATRRQLFRQVLSESFLLALWAGLVGAGLAVGAVSVLKQTAGFALPCLECVSVGWPVLLSCLGLSVLATLLAGFLPALRASQLAPRNGTKGIRPNMGTGREKHRLIGGIVVVQIALTLALLVNAGLMVRTVHKLTRVQTGFETRNILTMDVSLPDWGEGTPDFCVRAIPQIAALPGVKQAAFIWGLPLTGNKWWRTVTVEGQQNAQPEAVPVRSATPDYFEAFGIKIVQGRGFRSSDNWDDWKSVPDPRAGETRRVAIINEKLVEKLFPNTSPLGKKLFTDIWPKRPAEIVGVVANTHSGALNAEVEPEVYYCFWQCPVVSKHLVVHTTAEPRALVTMVQHQLRSINPIVSIERIKTMDQVLDDSFRPQTFVMGQLVTFSAAGVALALVGIYGVLSLSVEARSRELAIRIAVGAQSRDILLLVLREGVKLMSIGMLCGIALALSASHVLRALLFGVTPADLGTLGAAAILFLAVGLLACYIPARRATRTNPIVLLKSE